MMYAFSENYVLAYSHDEVVHGKRSMLDKMYGDYDQKFASLRALYGFSLPTPERSCASWARSSGSLSSGIISRSLTGCCWPYPRHEQLRDYYRKA